MRQKPKAYLETSVISYATGRLSRQLMVAAQQQYTTEWLEKFPLRYDGFVSELVRDEARDGDPEAAARRLAKADGFHLLILDEESRRLSREFLRCGSFPAKAVADSLHVGIAAANGMDFLVTWNCTHINNAIVRPRIEACCHALGYRCPVICTPQELEVDDD